MSQTTPQFKYANLSIPRTMRLTKIERPRVLADVPLEKPEINAKVIFEVGKKKDILSKKAPSPNFFIFEWHPAT